MQIDVLTLFPDMFSGFLNNSIIKKAIDNSKIKINIINFRDYSPLPHKQVDDTPYGGGVGMVLRCEPIFICLDKIKTKDSLTILLTPEGKIFNQSIANNLKEYKHIILICGHYEGFDERIKTAVDLEMSIGNFILTGGEIPALTIIDAITRLIPGVLKDDATLNESFNNNLLDYPTYTKPAEYRNLKVPSVLLSGDHKKIAEYRKNESIKKTKKYRPDMEEL